jgi:hypothetical protein
VLSRDGELEALVVLCRELAKLGLGVGMSDARPAVVIRVSAEPSVWVTVDASGEFFDWEEPGCRHPVADPAGAAALIAQHIKARPLGSGDGS